MAPTLAERGGSTCVAREPQWQNRRRRRARDRATNSTICQKETSSYVLDSALEKQVILKADVEKMMDNYKENFPTIAEMSERSKPPQLNNDVLSVVVSQSNLEVPWEVAQSEEHCKDMIEKLEQSERSEQHPIVVSQSNLVVPEEVPQSEESCKDMIEKLEQHDRSEHHALLSWLQKRVRMLAQQKHGSRVVQKALEVATGSDRDALIRELNDHVTELYESPHGNHVLSRAIEVLPATKFNFIISALLGKGVVVSKHKFGCRVVCRLIEHAAAEQINDLINEVLLNIESLARQAYGNFVVQSILEHGTLEWKSCVLLKLSAIFASLCMERSGSLVAQKMLDCCDHDATNYAIECLNNQGLVEVACTRYGSYVVEQLAGMQASCYAVRQSANILANSIQDLHCSEYAKKVVAAFELAPVELTVA